jgi:hypothetical protein
VPVVSEYCYLGLWFNNACNWNTHFEKMLAKVHLLVHYISGWLLAEQQLGPSIRWAASATI